MTATVTQVSGFPPIDTVANPAIFFDEDDAILAYAVATSGGDGCAIIRFNRVFSLSITPLNIDALHEHRYPCTYWEFNSVEGAVEAERWPDLHLQFWVISFRGSTIEVLFKDAELVFVDPKGSGPTSTLKVYLGTLP
jgi:hypothetical protein